MKIEGKETKLTNAEPTGRERDADKNTVIFAAEKADFRQEMANGDLENQETS